MENNVKVVDCVDALIEKIAVVREAQRKFSTYSEEQVDKIFLAAATAANKMRIPLARMAVEETDRKSTRLNSSHSGQSRMPSSA